MLKKAIFFTFIFCSFILSAFANQQKENSEINIIPKPLELELRKGSFIIKGSTKIYVSIEDKSITKIANNLAKTINDAKYYKVKVYQSKNENDKQNSIQFIYSENKEKFGKEGYSLDVSKNGVIITAHEANGFFYAVQTIYQLLPYQIFSGVSVGNIDLEMPSVLIFDKPSFTWRGNMLDPSRHFISVDFIKKNIDFLASLKMNIFHWHLTDDQGWRIEIKSFPKLTDVGAWRVDRNQDEWHGRKEQTENETANYGGFYSHEEIKEIIKYAADRYIEIIPEIDIPGHSRAAIASYPEISCDEANYKVATGGIMDKNTLCPGKEITFRFTENVLNEVMDLFPSKYIHIGGDECNKDSWKKCEHCQQRIKDNQLADEFELQSYFIKRVEKIINVKGKNMIGWDEILEGGLAPNATVMSWRGTEGGITAVREGHDVIMSPNSYCYLDLRQGETHMEPDYGYGKLLLSTAYSYNPIPEDFTSEEAKHILGVQGNLWGESMQQPFDHQYMLFPRLFAIAEVGWTPYELKDYSDFIKRTEYAFNRLDAMHVNYAPSMYNVAIEHSGSLLAENLEIELSTDANNSEIHYTIDGNDPNAHSPIYTKPFPITKTTIIKAQAFKNGNATGRLSTKTIQYHKAAGKKVKYITKPNSKFNTSEICLTNCLRGTLDYSKKNWVAFREADMEIEIDLEEIKDIHSITASFLHYTKSWIFLPLNVSFEVSIDGKNFENIGINDLSSEALTPGKQIKNSKVEFSNRKVRYIRVKAKNMMENPEWHASPGGNSWMFVDEIIVE